MNGMSSSAMADQRVYAQPTEPADRRDGIMWVDTGSSANDLYTFSVDEDDWILAAPSNISIQDTAPSAASLGDGWIDTSQDPPVLKLYDGAAWQQSNPLGWVYDGTTSINATGGYDTVSFSRQYDEIMLRFRDVVMDDGAGNYTNFNLQVNGATSGYNYRMSDGSTRTDTSEMLMAETYAEYPYWGVVRVSGGDNISASHSSETYTLGFVGGQCRDASGQVSQISVGRTFSGYTITGTVEVYGRDRR